MLVGGKGSPGAVVERGGTTSWACYGLEGVWCAITDVKHTLGLAVSGMGSRMLRVAPEWVVKYKGVCLCM